jgi:glycosyltransferase involved in cell wall biosynthesis
MRVLLDHPLPFLLGHGGLQIQIEQTYTALRQADVDVEYCRWWDDSQKPDIIHYFGRPSISYVDLAQSKGIRVVMSQLLTGLGSRAAWLLPIQKTTIRLVRQMGPRMVTSYFAWDVFRKVDAAIALTGWESHLMNYVFDGPKEKIHVVPNGVEETFFKSPKMPRGQWLVCTATVTERKRVLELAEAAVRAKTPLWIVGKPYSDSDPYARQFLALARSNAQFIRYEGAISDRAQLARIYREARGFVLLSTMESLSLSALEAAACECPLLLSDLPWARTTFGEQARYCPITSPSRSALLLRQFYDDAPNLKIPLKPPTWPDVAQQFKTIYENLLRM